MLILFLWGGGLISHRHKCFPRFWARGFCYTLLYVRDEINPTLAQLFPCVWRIAVWWRAVEETGLTLVPATSAGDKRLCADRFGLRFDNGMACGFPNCGVCFDHHGGMDVAGTYQRGPFSGGLFCRAVCVFCDQQFWRLGVLHHFPAHCLWAFRVLCRGACLFWSDGCQHGSGRWFVIRPV